MGNGEAARRKFGKQRLDIAQDGFAGRRIAHMAKARAALQAVDDLLAGEMIADEAHAAFGMEAFAVEGDDAGRFLAAMLKGVEAECGERCRIGMAVNAEDAAFFAQAVAVDVEICLSLAGALSECGLLRCCCRCLR